ncbi:MAG TPA: GTP cyclohydrolase I FolE [Nocardioidaceae bacterium]|jgi:GTP cyclohydrolase I|nr:GTP cyclohydrolase I FolE [Nocardioidaceae bacterium]
MSQAPLPQPQHQPQDQLPGPPGRPAETSWRPRIVHDQDPVDLVAAERAATDLLRALGLPLQQEALADTPRRMATALAEMLTVPAFDFTTFPNTEDYDELVLVEDIPVRSVCEHHVLPFVGVAHIGYLPGDRILGLSKLARVVDFFAHRPQTQERLTKQIADQLQRQLAPRGVGVVVEAEHTCMTLRGVRAVGARTATSALHGTLRDDPAARAEFLSLTHPRKESR